MKLAAATAAVGRDYVDFANIFEKKNRRILAAKAAVSLVRAAVSIDC